MSKIEGNTCTKTHKLGYKSGSLLFMVIIGLITVAGIRWAMGMEESNQGFAFYGVILFSALALMTQHKIAMIRNKNLHHAKKTIAPQSSQRHQ